LKGSLTFFLKSGRIDVKSETSGLSAMETLFNIIRKYIDAMNTTRRHILKEL